MFAPQKFKILLKNNILYLLKQRFNLSLNSIYIKFQSLNVDKVLIFHCHYY